MYSRCSFTEIKELCRACKLEPTELITEMAEMLCNNEHASKYAFDSQRITVQSMMPFSNSVEDDNVGISLDHIKQLATEKGLSVSGKRSDIVLRLLQLENGVGAPKRTIQHENGGEEVVPKKRAKSMKLPENDNLRARIRTKIFGVNTSKFSDNKYKNFASNLMEEIAKIITGESVFRACVKLLVIMFVSVPVVVVPTSLHIIFNILM